MKHSRRERSSRPTALLVTVIAAAALVCGQWLRPEAASAGTYKGWGDTGWTEDNKRDCCADAVALAQDDSAGMCRNAGGQPRFRGSSSRGVCDWDVQNSGSDRVYRCTANAQVDCW